MNGDYDSNEALVQDTAMSEDVIESDGCLWFRDDFPLWGSQANELSVTDRLLIDHFVPIRGIVSDGITYYVYCRSIASWSQMESDSTSNELLEVANINAHLS